jgi:hypothetical protein
MSKRQAPPAADFSGVRRIGFGTVRACGGAVQRTLASSYEFIWRLRKKRLQTARMTFSARILVPLCVLLAGCGTAKKAAITTFRVVDAPARFVRDRIDPPVTTTTTTVETDVVNPGYPIAAPTPTPPTAPPRVAGGPRGGSSAPGSQRPPRTAGGATTPPGASVSGTPRPKPPTTDFPIARPVPGRPGFVYSLDPNGGIVDVNGYKPGDKAKDPYTKQIFVVP